MKKVKIITATEAIKKMNELKARLIAYEEVFAKKNQLIKELHVKLSDLCKVLGEKNKEIKLLRKRSRERDNYLEGE